MAEFLRARREQLQPTDVGLPDRGRRRTPGLRREEVATLAGVSIDYLVRLEQGRDTRPSPSVIAALAEALQLDDDERRQFSILAMFGQSSELCPGPSPLTHQVAPTVTALLDRLGPAPAFVVGPSNDVLAWNEAWDHLVRPLGMLEGATPDLARHVFLHPGARTAYPDWDAAADEQVSRLRAASGRWGDDPGFAALMDELRTSPDFVTRWSGFGTIENRRGMKRILHPDLGELRIDYEVLLLPGDDEKQRLIAWLPPTTPPRSRWPGPGTGLFHPVRRGYASSARRPLRLGAGRASRRSRHQADSRPERRRGRATGSHHGLPAHRGASPKPRRRVTRCDPIGPPSWVHVL